MGKAGKRERGCPQNFGHQGDARPTGLRQSPLVLRRPANVLPIWRRSCALITGMPLGKGLGAVGGAIPPGKCSLGL